MKSQPTIAMIGLGYIGLPTACLLAKSGITVSGIDINQSVVDQINRGEIHFVEPGLNVVLKEVTSKGQLKAFTTPQVADVYIIAVPTPFNGHSEPDMTYVEAAALSIAPLLKIGDLVILESTSPVGSTRHLSEMLAEARPDLVFPHQWNQQEDVPRIHLAYCPERILPGKALEELVANDRILGGMTSQCAKLAENVYKNFVRGECWQTTAETAEMAKLTENAYRDVNIAFANELSLICDKLNIDVWELIQLANHHPRVNILKPGPGVGGHCIAVDPWFIYHKTPDLAKMIATARAINDGKPDFVLTKIQEAVDDIEKNGGKVNKISFLGLTFKPNIDDLRESPALSIVEKWSASRPAYPIAVVEPHIQQLPSSLAGFSNLRLETLEEALSSDVCVILVAHEDFVVAKNDLMEYKGCEHKRILDFQGILSSSSGSLTQGEVLYLETAAGWKSRQRKES